MKHTILAVIIMAVTPSQFSTIALADLDGTETAWVQKGGIDYKLSLTNVKQYGGCDVYCTSLVIATAQVLTLNSAPIEIVAAPGAGYFIEVVSASVRMVYNTTPYATSTSISLYNSTSGGYEATSTNFLAIASAGTFISKFALNDGGSSGNIAVNDALKVFVPTLDPTAGDSDIEVYVQYRIVTV